MDKLVSIVVPVYNAEKYIYNCVESIMKQVYKNLEIILVDDGSIDTSPLICDKLAQQDSRIKVIHKKNGGVSSARNAGIEMVTGEYLMFADSDDIVDGHWVARMVQLAELWNVNFVICTYRLCKTMYEAMIPINHEKAFEPVWAMSKEEFYSVLGYMMTFRETMFAPWNKLFVTSIVKEHKIQFPEDMSYGEDLLFNLKYLEYCNGVIETREQLYNYIMQNTDSLEAKYKPDLFENQTRLYKAVKQFMIEHNVYRGYNVSNISYYYTKRVLASIVNQFHEKNEKSSLNTRKYVESIVNDLEVQEAVSYADLHETELESCFTDMMRNHQYENIYDELLKIDSGMKERPANVRYKNQESMPYGIRWIPYTFKSIKKYGIFITFKRITGKISRKLRRK